MLTGSYGYLSTIKEDSHYIPRPVCLTGKQTCLDKLQPIKQSTYYYKSALKCKLVALITSTKAPFSPLTTHASADSSQYKQVKHRSALSTLTSLPLPYPS